MKVVINAWYGGYSLSRAAYDMLGIEWDGYGFEFDGDRSNKLLVSCVEELGELASGCVADLVVIEIPDGVDFVIEEHDGKEWVAERHRTWHPELEAGK